MRDYKMFDIAGEETTDYTNAVFLYFPTDEAIDELIADYQYFEHSVNKNGEGWYFYRFGNNGPKYYWVPNGLVYAIQSQK